MGDGPGGKNVGRLSLKVLPDTSDFLDELKAFAERVEREVRVELDVLLNIESAQQELKELQARLEAADLKVDIATGLDGAGALAHLEILLQAMQGTADLHPINVDVDVDGSAEAALVATSAAAAQGAANASRMGGQIALWGPLIFVAAVGIAALAPALLVLFPLVAGIALGAGAIFAGFEELADVLKPIGDAFKEMRAEIGAVLTEGLRPLISEFVSGFMPVLKDGLIVGAQLMNSLLTSVLEFLNSASGITLVSELFAGLGPALDPLMKAMGPLVELFVRLSIAALPGLQMMSEAILRVVEDLNKWLGANDISDDISTSMSQLGDVLSIIGSLVRDLFGPLVAAAPAVIGLLGGIGETLGTMFQFMQPAFEFMSEHVGTMGLLGSVLTVVAVGIGAVSAAMAIFNVVAALNPFVLLAIGVAALVAGLVYAYTHFEVFRNLVNVVFATIQTVITTVVAFILAHWQAFVVGLLAIVLGPLGALVALIVLNFGTIKDFVVNIFNTVVGYLKGAWDSIVNMFTSSMNAAMAIVSAVMSAIGTVINTTISTAVAVVRGISAVGTFFTNAFNTAKTAVTDTVSEVVSTLTGLPGKAVSALGDLSGTLVGAGKQLIQGFINGIGEMFDSVRGKLGDLTSKLTSWKGPESLDKVILFDAGRYVIGGFIDGLESQYGAVEDSLGGFTDGLSDLASFDGEAALKFSGTSGVLPQLDSLLTLGGGSDATRLIIENWDTGIGHMRNIAEDAVTGYEAATVARTPPKEEAP
jgi:phage-related protein